MSFRTCFGIYSSCHAGGGELIHENLFLMDQEPKEAKPIFISASITYGFL
ncbi:MAG: hypothetical protein LBM09_02065 [Candidatus Nomurabacteria bacterium]|nr:hypothetical protein [Candidatus Nomurabacteria bacterium]